LIDQEKWKMIKAHMTLYLAVFITVACLLSAGTEARDRSPGPDAVEVDAVGLPLVHVVCSNVIKERYIVAQAGWRDGYENVLVKGGIGIKKTKKPDTLSKSGSSTKEKAAKSPSKKRVNRRKN
jgi:hypothetical protein